MTIHNYISILGSDKRSICMIKFCFKPMWFSKGRALQELGSINKNQTSFFIVLLYNLSN
uniref:ribosomal protein S16 n=1 Tax=Juniperus osteosperma TaxID=114264 RepID=UPI00226CD9E1|nr:ribosomal protein S16 [Juniperus osteosperma]UZH44382.1 ribosomal protein S16 [Juniperus osteosperma]